MYGFKIQKKDAQTAKKYLIENNLLSENYRPKKIEDTLIFPLSQNIEDIPEYAQIVNDVEFNENRPILNFKDEVLNILNDEEKKSLKTSYDTLGTIAILEIDEVLEKKEQKIANILLKTNPAIKTVLKKAGIHGGEFRTQPMQYLAGIETKETMHSENNVRIKVNAETVYFSPRLSTERKRISALIKPGEEILVMFCGSAPYPTVLAKNTKAKHITGIEINPEGHKYGLDNIKLNKINNVTLINGDVRVEVPKLNKTFDRILMPLPKTADEFLDSALLATKSGTVIHMYDFLHEDQFQEAFDKIEKACTNSKFNYKIIELVKCGQHAPRVFRICVDFQIL